VDNSQTTKVKEKEEIRLLTFFLEKRFEKLIAELIHRGWQRTTPHLDFIT